MASLLLLQQLLAQDVPVNGPAQPVSFSHRQHAGTLKLECKTCHVNPDPGELMTYPDEKKCMACHATVKADSQEIRKLAKFVEEQAHVPWVRVYRLPTYVFWSHKSHSDAKCSECHGDVASRDRLFVEKPLSMARCVACHRANQVQVHCTFCHEQRN